VRGGARKPMTPEHAAKLKAASQRYWTEDPDRHRANAMKSKSRRGERGLWISSKKRRAKVETGRVG
jgi:hypothetical protein